MSPTTSPGGSDRTRRKPWIAWGYGLAALGKVVVASAPAWPVVLTGRVADRFGKGIRSAPRDALIAESVPRDSLGRAFGFHRAGDTIGAVIGPLLGLLALQAFSDDIRTVLYVAAVPAVLSVLLVLLVREPARRRAPAPAAPRRVRRPVRSPLPARFWRVAAGLTLIALVNFPDVLVLLRVSDLGWSPTEVVAGYVVFNVSYAALSYPAGARGPLRTTVPSTGSGCSSSPWATSARTRSTAAGRCSSCSPSTARSPP